MGLLRHFAFTCQLPRIATLHVVAALGAALFAAACAAPDSSELADATSRDGVDGKSSALAFGAELNLRGYWTFDRQATPEAEASSKSLEAMISNATWTASGRSAGALYFNGTNALVTLPDGGWNVGNPVTYNLWYKSEGTAKGYLVDHVFSTAASGAFAAVYHAPPNAPPYPAVSATCP